jgi:anti-sigma factor RsiW
MPIEHLRYQRYVDAFVDGELDGRRRDKVAAHIAACPQCSRDAGLTVNMKYSLARTRGIPRRAMAGITRMLRLRVNKNRNCNPPL